MGVLNKSTLLTTFRPQLSIWNNWFFIDKMTILTGGLKCQTLILIKLIERYKCLLFAVSKYVFKVNSQFISRLSWLQFYVFIIGCEQVFIYFFYQGFLSRTLANHRAAGEEIGTSFTPFYHFHPRTNIQTFISNFACEITITYF